MDWRGRIIAEGQAFRHSKGLDVDWASFADGWRAKYQPAMERVRDRRAGWVKLDDLHWQNLDELLEEMAITSQTDKEVEHLNNVWHELNPWSDTIEGFTRLKTKYILATLSNGNVALIVNMAKYPGLPWNVVLGAEVTGHYKPQPEAYMKMAQFFDLAPKVCLMVAAHNGDFVTAESCGLGTAFVSRPGEFGNGKTSDKEAENKFNYLARDFLDLADQLGC